MGIIVKKFDLPEDNLNDLMDVDSVAEVDDLMDIDLPPLHNAASIGDLDLVRKLALPHTINDPDAHGNIALHHSEKMGHDQVSKLLIFRGADSSRKNCQGKTPAELKNKKTASVGALY